MTDDQVFQFVKQLWENRDRSSYPGEKGWAWVAKKLADKGHTSPRTGRALSSEAVRSIYYNFEKKPALGRADLSAQIRAMKGVASLRADDSTKLKLLLQMLDTLDG